MPLLVLRNLIPLMRVIYDEKNLVFRHRMSARLRPWVAELYAAIIRQGVGEGTFETSDPVQAAGILVDLWNSMGEPLARLIVDLPERPDNLATIRDKLTFYENAAERILGVAEGSLRLIEESGMLEVLAAMEKQIESGGRR